MLFKSLFVLATAALTAYAQSATTTSDAAVPSGVTPCILSCSSQAASAGNCSSFSDLTCVCTSTAFQDAAGACLQANCTTAEVAQAQALQQSECASISGNSTTTTSGTSTSTSTSTNTSPATTASGAKTSAATSSGAATGLAPSLALNSAFGGLVALAGTLIGAAFVV
ncbi:uncharacterized protein F5147DRAFT_287195 [Suillus discolor]|uniref:CFEM domain-containing protein n=1 Tax=Suillus discolor TaxID=1912936 RepID=A0A9P7F1L4_9AGAM|nr:uncharacterized protein F5147DRAFT_287195 [Suillus discolor]KAG2102848.1 hypothetical protein F5147DRAFT_287195 [Suillus discolor]